MSNEDLRKVLMTDMAFLPWGRDGKGQPVRFLSDCRGRRLLLFGVLGERTKKFALNAGSTL